MYGTLCQEAFATPHEARLDARGTLHHHMARGLERRAVCRDDADRAGFLRRLPAVAERGGMTVYVGRIRPTDNRHVFGRMAAPAST